MTFDNILNFKIMKKNIFKILAAVVVCGLLMTLFIQCNREEEETENPVTDNVRLTQIYRESIDTVTGNLTLTTTMDLVWEEGLLKSDHASMYMAMYNTTVDIGEEHFYYSGNNCIEKHYLSLEQDIHEYYTYTGERMTSAVKVEKGDTTAKATIHSYTDDGHVKSMTIQNIKYNYTTDYEFTWENGDMTSYRGHPVVPAGEDEIHTATYDNYPNVHIGKPLSDYIFAPAEMLVRGSKHNVVSDNNEYIYANGRLVVERRKDHVVYYTFSDGTTGRP